MISELIGHFFKHTRKLEKSFGFETELKWQNIIVIFGVHILAVYWTILYAFPVKWQTLIFVRVGTVVVALAVLSSFDLAWQGLVLVVIYQTSYKHANLMLFICGIGITCGAHRLWTHKSYKVKRPLNIFLVLCYACVGQNPIYIWVRDHRIHHKYSDTDADPHNIRRGFFFAHIGWFMMKHKKEVIEKGKQIDMSDIEADPVLVFERRYSIYLGLLFCHIIPTLIGIYLLGENWKCAVAWHNFIRPMIVFHAEFSVNSFAHTFGYKPYNKNIPSSENPIVSLLTWGEGWHNYHHTFPYDYKASEFVDFNISMRLINLWARLGLAYDLKEASPELVKAVSKRLSDGNKDKNIIFEDNGNVMELKC